MGEKGKVLLQDRIAFATFLIERVSLIFRLHKKPESCVGAESRQSSKAEEQAECSEGLWRQSKSLLSIRGQWESQAARPAIHPSCVQHHPVLWEIPVSRRSVLWLCTFGLAGMLEETIRPISKQFTELAKC